MSKSTKKERKQPNSQVVQSPDTSAPYQKVEAEFRDYVDLGKLDLGIDDVVSIFEILSQVPGGNLAKRSVELKEGSLAIRGDSIKDLLAQLNAPRMVKDVTIETDFVAIGQPPSGEWVASFRFRRSPNHAHCYVAAKDGSVFAGKRAQLEEFAARRVADEPRAQPHRPPETDANQSVRSAFNGRVTLGSLALRRDDLFALETVLSDTPGGMLRRRSVHVTNGTREIYADSVVDLLKHTGLPESTRELSIATYIAHSDDSVSSGDSLRLHFIMHRNFASCDITAEDEGVFLGKKAQLIEFARMRRPWYALLHKVLVPIMALLLVSALLAAMATIQLKQYSRLIWCGAGILGSLGYLVLDHLLFPYESVHFSEKRLAVFRPNVVGAGAAVVSALAGLGSFLVALFK